MGPALLKLVIEELGALLTGGIISKIHQPDDKEIILTVFARGADLRLLISAHHRLARLHLTEREFENPPTPPRFCAFLRSRITNARITCITAEPGQRIARIGLLKHADRADETFILTAELTGKSANVILTDGDGVVLDSLKYFQPESSQRAVMPGLKLAPLAPRPALAGFKRGTTPSDEEPILKEEGVTWNSAVDRRYSELSDEEITGLRRSRLRRAINDAAKRLKRKIENLNNDKKHAEENLCAEMLGQLVAQNLGRIKRGDAEVAAVNYAKEPPEEVKIPLDPKLGPKENLEKFFKRSKKAKAALALLRDRLPQTGRELDYIAELEYEWENATAPEELRAIEDELMNEGYLKKAPDAGHKTKPEQEQAEPVRRFTSSDGFEMLCGKNAAGNDLIVKRHASGADIWFHAEGVPGSHVLIKTAGRAKEVTKKTIEEAAALAAWHSKAQTAAKAAVVYTEARNVRKPGGAKPGMVTLKEYRTIVVKPRAME
ncbi:MAG: NFACT family protein [Deltaproteobacteria bacterium]|nr:NFACT family protein [Deltaproteobacteria bacterium]